MTLNTVSTPHSNSKYEQRRRWGRLFEFDQNKIKFNHIWASEKDLKATTHPQADQHLNKTSSTIEL